MTSTFLLEQIPIRTGINKACNGAGEEMELVLPHATPIPNLNPNLAPVVQRLDNAIHRINHYLADKC